QTCALPIFLDWKVCGFLTEVVSESGVINAIICGIGINVFKDDTLRKIPTAISIEETAGGTEHMDMDLFMKVFMDNIEVYYNRFQCYKSIVFGRQLRITEPGGMFFGRALDITDDGFLEVLDEDGNIRKVVSADIEL